MAKAKKIETPFGLKTIGQLVHHQLDSVSFILLVLNESTTTLNGITTRHYTVERKSPKSLADSLFGFGSGTTASVAVGNFFEYCADANKAFNQGVTFGYADKAVLEFCNNEMFDELEAKHNENLKAQSNG